MDPSSDSSAPRPPGPTPGRRGIFAEPGRRREGLLSGLLAGLAGVLAVLAAGALVAELDGARDEILDPAEIERRLEVAGSDEARAFWRGRRAFLDGDLEAAAGGFREALAEGGNDAALYFWLGRTYARLAGRENGTLARAAAARRSRRSFEQAVERDPEYLPPRIGLVRFHLAAPGLVGGDLREAHHQAREIARRDPYLGHLAWGAVFEQEERWERAVQTYRRAIRTRPEDSEGYLRLVWMLQGRGRFDEAFGVLAQLRAAVPQEARQPYEVGRTAAFSGRRLAEGEAALDSFLSRRRSTGEGFAGDLAPSPAQALCHLGMIQRHRGENGRALTTFRRALALEPDLAEARRNVEELERLSSGG